MRGGADPWPSLGTVTTDSDACTSASVLLEGEQKPVLPSEGSEQDAASCTPQKHFLFLVSPLLHMVAHDTLHGERLATEGYVEGPDLEV